MPRFEGTTQELLWLILEELERQSALLTPHKPGHAISVDSQFEQRRIRMPLTAPANTQNEKFYAIGTDATGASGASLGPGRPSQSFQPIPQR